MVRALGPGSVSSLLKIVLDVVFFALWVGIVFLALAMLVALLLSFDPEVLSGIASLEISRRGPILVGGLFAWLLYTAGVLVIVGRVRRIFATLTAGDPFHPDNVRRLHIIGLMLAGLELGRYLVWMLTASLPDVARVEPTFSLTAWFSVLVVFVLAEVFREGARLRREAELTI